MNREHAQVVAGIVERIDKIEKTIFELQSLSNCDSFEISGFSKELATKHTVNMRVDEISTVIFSQEIVEFFIDTLNLELGELVKELEKY